jgi:phosphoglycolate phosphatase-like HAD superfamily hydrolase
MIFDVDGTLVDTNPAHVEAWRKAFLKMGHQVPTSRIVLEIGKGGDLLVPSVLGEQAEEHEGEALRKRQKEEFLAIARKERFRLFAGAREIFPALRKRGVLTALATSSNDKHLEATLASAGVDLRGLADKVVTKTEDETSKPAPDLIVAAVEELQLPAASCAMVGDTVYDGAACGKAGVTFFGVLSGGTPESALREAGARMVFADVAAMLEQLDRTLETAVLDAAAQPRTLLI